MSLKIYGSKNETSKSFLSLDNKVKSSQTALQNDQQGVFALSTIAEGEKALRNVFERAAQKSISGQEEKIIQQAQSRVDKILAKIPHKDTEGIVAKHLGDSLQAFELRTRDLALREHMFHCAEQAKIREQDVLLNLSSLQESAKNSPDQTIREKANSLAEQQINNLRQTGQAMSLALSRYDFPAGSGSV